MHATLFSLGEKLLERNVLVAAARGQGSLGLVLREPHLHQLFHLCGVVGEACTQRTRTHAQTRIHARERESASHALCLRILGEAHRGERILR